MQILAGLVGGEMGKGAREGPAFPAGMLRLYGASVPVQNLPGSWRVAKPTLSVVDVTASGPFSVHVPPLTVACEKFT